MGNVAGTEMMASVYWVQATCQSSVGCGICMPWFWCLHIRDEEAETRGNSLSVLGSIMHSSSGTSMSVSSTYHYLALNVPLAYGRQGLQGVKVCEFGYEQGVQKRHVITESKLILLTA